MTKTRRVWLGAVAALAVALLAGATPQSAPPPRLSIELGASFADTTLGPAAILSPDGAVMVFVAQKADGEKRQLYMRRLDELRDMAAPRDRGSG